MNGLAVVAAVAAVVVLGAHLALPVLATRRSGPAGRGTALLLALDTAAVLVGGIVLAAAAGRSWQLIGRPPGTTTPDAVLQVANLEGDGDLYALLVVGIGLATLLATVLLGVTARAVGGDQPGDRTLVRTVLGAEVLVGLVAASQVLTGGRSAALLVLVAHLPLSALALRAERRAAEPVPSPAAA